jgi:hypothetical protein
MNGTRRALLTSIAALGSVISLASTTGVFAVFHDQATTGTNTFATKGLPHAAALQLATGSVTVGVATWSVDCGTYSDDLESGLMTLTDAAPGAGFDTDFVCVKNAGSQTVNVTASTIDVTDVDTDCTGDEGSVDTTCGADQTTSAAQAGELGPLVDVSVVHADCSDANQGGSGIGPVPTATVGVATLAPGEKVCVRFDMSYDPTEADAQVAQSDTLTWKFAFDGTVPTT